MLIYTCMLLFFVYWKWKIIQSKILKAKVVCVTYALYSETSEAIQQIKDIQLFSWAKAEPVT